MSREIYRSNKWSREKGCGSTGVEIMSGRGHLLFSAVVSLGLLVAAFLPASIQAQEIVAFGEIKASGSVQIESSAGKWIDIQPVYPLLKKTRIRTNNGVVFITARDGSRIDLSKETEASIDAAGGGYSITLIIGTVSFNAKPGISLAVVTEEASVAVERQAGEASLPLAGRDAQRFANIQGLVIRDCKGTHVKSVAGRMDVSGQGFQAKSLHSEDTFFASVKDGSSACLPAGTGSNTRLVRGLITGAFFTSGALVSLEASRGNGVHSNHVP